MTYRPDRELAGFCKVWFSDGTACIIKRNEYEPIFTALRAGQAWHEAEDLFGDQVLIRLADVLMVMDCSPASIALADAEADERKAHDTAHGEA